MSIIIVRAHQIGIDSVTPNNNFSFEVPTVPDGTLRLGRGNSNATTSTIFTVDANNNVTFNGQVYGVQPPGMYATFMLPTAPTGWVAGDGNTIGNVGSGATRANVDTLALFTAWWTAYTNAQLPILTSTGAASTRGASAAADWTALKRLTVFDVRDRFIRNASATNLNGTKYEGSSVWTDSIGDTTLRQVSGSTGVQNGENVTLFTAAQTYTQTGTTYVPSATGQRFVKVRPDNIAMLGCFKL